MQNNRVVEVEGINDSYNPLKVSIDYSPGSRSCTVYLRRETHTMGNLLKYQLMHMPEVESVGCGMVHPHDIEILQLKMHLRDGGAQPDRLLTRALDAVTGDVRALRDRWRGLGAAAAGST